MKYIILIENYQDIIEKGEEAIENPEGETEFAIGNNKNLFWKAFNKLFNIKNDTETYTKAKNMIEKAKEKGLPHDDAKKAEEFLEKQKTKGKYSP